MVIVLPREQVVVVRAPAAMAGEKVTVVDWRVVQDLLEVLEVPGVAVAGL